MEIIRTLLLTLTAFSIKIPALSAINCYQEMTYHEKYGYGYDISCQNLNRTNLDELRNVTVYNEVRVLIEKSNLTVSDSDPLLFQNIPKTRQIIIRDSNVLLAGDNGTNPGPFSILPQLEELTLFRSNLSAIPGDLFDGLSNLKILNFSRNSIPGLKKGSLKSLERLTELDLSGNRLTDLEEVPICEVRQLKKLHLHGNYLKSIGDSSLACLKLLKTLTLDYNRLASITSLSHHRYLIGISLSYNFVEDLGAVFAGSENLEEINLEGNKLKSIKGGWFDGLPALKKLNLKNNPIGNVASDALSNLSSLEELDFERNGLKGSLVLQLPSLKRLNLSFNNFSGFGCEFCDAPALEILTLKGCEIAELKKDQFRCLGRLKQLDLSHNRVIMTSTFLFGLHNLNDLDLSRNSMLSLPNYGFNFAGDLKRLDLSHNELKKLNDLTFHNLIYLEGLNLSYNRLEVLHESVVFPMKNLRTLDLEGNRLKSIDYDIIISLLANLKSINIRENELSCELLSQMLTYFRTKGINYTINEKLTYNEENVAGIHCQEKDRFNSSFSRADSILVNDTEVLNEIYHIAKDDNKSLNASLSTTLLILVLVVFVLFLSIAGISYRIYIVVKRRNYISDEIELLDSRIHKWNNNNNV